MLRPGPNKFKFVLQEVTKAARYGGEWRDPGPRGLWARSPGGLGPQGLGPGPPWAWGLFPTKTTKPLKLRFFANLLVGAWRRHGCRLKRLLRRWGPGGKRSRDTPPTPLPPCCVFWCCLGERKRVKPLRLRQPSNTPPKVGGLGCVIQVIFAILVYIGLC